LKCVYNSFIAEIKNCNCSSSSFSIISRNYRDAGDVSLWNSRQARKLARLPSALFADDAILLKKKS